MGKCLCGAFHGQSTQAGSDSCSRLSNNPAHGQGRAANRTGTVNGQIMGLWSRALGWFYRRLWEEPLSWLVAWQRPDRLFTPSTQEVTGIQSLAFEDPLVSRRRSIRIQKGKTQLIQPLPLPSHILLSCLALCLVHLRKPCPGQLALLLNTDRFRGSGPSSPPAQPLLSLLLRLLYLCCFPCQVVATLSVTSKGPGQNALEGKRGSRLSLQLGSSSGAGSSTDSALHA